MKFKNILKPLFAAALIACLTVCAFGCGNNSGGKGGNVNNEEQRTLTQHAVYNGVQLPDELWTAPEYVRSQENDRTDKRIKGEIQAIYYRSDYNGQQSYAFAFLGIPQDVTQANPAPAVLLVHGGGGTAYWQWVCEWVNRGYVALAMDLEGHVPLPDGTSDNMPADLYTDSEYAAPHNQNYGDAALPIQQTWMYYAVSTAIRGNSLLHSLPYVNKYKIGVCGVSWGGVITSIITGYDDRFAFSIPIYCSLNLAEGGSCNLGGYYRNHPEAQVWDDDEGLSKVNTPLLLLAMNNDPNALCDSLSATVKACRNAQIALVGDWAHSHTHAFARQEPYAFADGIVNGGDGLVKINGTVKGSKGSVTFTLPKDISVRGAYIYVTDSALNGAPSFTRFRLTPQGNKLNYEITDEIAQAAGGEVTWYYICIEDSLGRVVSTVAVEP